MGNAESQNEAPRTGPEIFLNVYNQGAEANSNQQVQVPTNAAAAMGLGVHHSGLEVLGREYTFAGGEFSGSGMQEQAPKSTPPGSSWIYDKTIPLGRTDLTDAEVRQVLREIREQFPAKSYDLMTRNCNHFTEVLSHRLHVQKAYPGWVNRAAKWGSNFQSGGQPDILQNEKRMQEARIMENRRLEKEKKELASRKQSLNPEPPADSKDAIQIQVICPNGNKISRRFFPTDTFGDVCVFACAHDASITAKTINLRSNFPRKVYSDMSAQLKASGIPRRENLFVEKRR